MKSMGARIWLSLALSLAMGTACAAQTIEVNVGRDDRPAETKDRLDTDVIEKALQPVLDLVSDNRLTEAEQEFSRELEVRKGRPDFSKTDELDTVTVFAIHLCSSDHPEVSFPYLRRAVELSIIAFGSNHPETALAYTDLGDCLGKAEETRTGAERLASYKRSYEIRLVRLGEDNPETIAAADDLANLSLEQQTLNSSPEKITEALALYDSTIAKFEALGPAYRGDLVLALGRRAASLLRLGRVEKANGDMDRALTLGTELDVGDVGNAVLVLAECQRFADQYQQQGNAEQAASWKGKCSDFSKARLDPFFAAVKAQAQKSN